MANFTYQEINTDRYFSGINPRPAYELDYMVLLPSIVATKAVLDLPIVVLELEPDDPMWDIRDGKFPITTLEERSKRDLLGIGGERRLSCLRYITANPDKHDAETVANAAKCQAKVYTGLTEGQARNLAVDTEGKKALSMSASMGEVIRRIEETGSYLSTIREFPHLCYGIINNGQTKYNAANRINEYEARVKQYEADLRNTADQLLQTAVLVGPGAVKALIDYTRVKVDKVPLADGEQLQIHCKVGHFQKLRKVYTNSVTGSSTVAKEKKKESEMLKANYTPVTEISRDIETGEPIVVGGNAEVKAHIFEMMDQFRNNKPSAGNGPTTMKKKDMEAAQGRALSKATKADCDLLMGVTGDSTIRDLADENAHWLEQRQEWCIAKRDQFKANGVKIDGLLENLLIAFDTCRNQVDFDNALNAIVTAMQPAKPVKSKGKKAQATA